MLLEFVQRLILSYDDSLRLNSAGCLIEGVNFDEGTVSGNEQKWSGIPSTQISEWRHNIAVYLQGKMNSESPEAKNRQGGRGIVMAAGDHAAAT